MPFLFVADPEAIKADEKKAAEEKAAAVAAVAAEKDSKPGTPVIAHHERRRTLERGPSLIDVMKKGEQDVKEAKEAKCKLWTCSFGSCVRSIICCRRGKLWKMSSIFDSCLCPTVDQPCCFVECTLSSHFFAADVPEKWLSDAAWTAIMALNKLDKFAGIEKHFVNNQRPWRVRIV